MPAFLLKARIGQGEPTMNDNVERVVKEAKILGNWLSGHHATTGCV